jgi:beta-phosphoglucomutase-like phosphatase (HAD superfamily)
MPDIKSALESTGLRSYFVFSVAAEDFVQEKPHPESFPPALKG